MEISSDDPWASGYLAVVLAGAGQRDEAKKIVEELKRPADGVYIAPFALALGYTALGEKKEAIALLQKEVARTACRSASIRISTPSVATRNSKPYSSERTCPSRGRYKYRSLKVS